jgi:hypothetical protein
VPSATSLQRHGYRFDLRAEKDSFQVVATPLNLGLRAFVADDTGLVRLPEE